jgi:DNA-directed RNA polymerase subunit RPC12/RpoP
VKYTCGDCGETFESAWSEEEALAEMHRDFGDLAQDDRVVVCDDCYQAMEAKRRRQ